MIDAEMYGMMPRAKIERRLRAPPEKRSRKPNTPPPIALKNSDRATGSMPGVGMCDPRRYTASRANVKMIRLRRSGMAKMLRTVSTRFNLLDLLAGSACRFDLLFGSLGELGRVHGQLLGELAVAEDLDAVVTTFDQAGATERCFVDRRSVVETLQI